VRRIVVFVVTSLSAPKTNWDKSPRPPVSETACPREVRRTWPEVPLADGIGLGSQAPIEESLQGGAVRKQSLHEGLPGLCHGRRYLPDSAPGPTHYEPSTINSGTEIVCAEIWVPETARTHS
jgi:hypothetical protein